MKRDYKKYYDLENYILGEVRDHFAHDGYLSAFDFFCIIIWKANRSKSKVAKRLLAHTSNLESGIKSLTSELFKANSDKEKLRILIKDYGFRLPTASAILSLLYPNNFTIYDVRVCEILPKFKKLSAVSDYEKLWLGYTDFIKNVRDYMPKEASLRNIDKHLWGKSFYEQLNCDLKNSFAKKLDPN